MELQEAIDKIKELCTTITNEIDIVDSNKSAAKRVRKATNAMTKLGRDFRKLSVAHDKTW